MMTADTFKRGLLRLAPFAPAILLAILIPQYWVDVPQYDEWDSVMLFEHLSQGSLTVGLLFKQVNEYRQFFPNLIFVGLGKLTHWDLRYEMILIFVVACLICLTVRWLAIRTTQASEIELAVLMSAANLVIFSLTQYENWFQAQQLVYYVPVLCVTTCILVGYSRLGTVAKFVICAALSFVSMFSSANGVVCWAVVLPLLVFTEWPKNRRTVGWLSAAWITATLLCVALYLYDFHKPWWTPSPWTALYHPWRAFVYFIGFLGGPLGLEGARLSVVAGGVMMLGFVSVCLFLLKHRADRILIERTIGWLVIAAYSLGTAALTTVGRVGLASGPWQVPRYLGFSVYLLVALIFLAHIIGEDIRRRTGRLQLLRTNALTFAMVLILLLYQPSMFALSYRQMDAWQTRLLQAKASILMINQLPDTRLTKTLYPNVQFLIEKANALDRLGLLRPSLIKSNDLKLLPDDPPGNFGNIRAIEKTPGGYLASGTCEFAQPSPDAIILAYQIGDNDPIAFALTHPMKPPASILRGPAKTGSWQVGFTPAQLPSSQLTITAWGLDATTGRAFLLSGDSRIDNAH